MNGKQAGVTLIELVVGMSLMLIIMGSLAGIISVFMKQAVKEIDLNDRQQEARWAVDMVAQDIRYANKLTTTGTTNITIVKTNSAGTSIQVTYYLAMDNTNKTYVLTRDVKSPATASAVTATNVLSNPIRGYVNNSDFAIKVTPTASGTTVAQVNIVYKIRNTAIDTNPAIAQTTIYPVNGLAIK